MIKTFKYNSKKFLNKNGFHSDANIVTSLKVGTRDRGIKVPYIYGTLEMKDCNSKIALSIDLHERKEFINTKRKVDILIDELTKFRENMVYCRELYDEILKEHKSKENGKNKRPVSKGDSDDTQAVPQRVRRRG